MVVYGFGISTIDAHRYSGQLSASKGFIGTIEHPQGLLLVFDNLNEAKILRNILEFDGCQVGKYVTEVEIGDAGDSSDT